MNTGRIRWCLFCVTCALVMPVSTWAVPNERSRLNKQVAELRHHQDRTAKGEEAAREAVRAALSDLAQDLGRRPATAPGDPEVYRAIMIFLLSGGDYRVVEHLATSAQGLPQQELQTLAGVLAYAQGRSADAIRAFSILDIEKLDPAVGAQVALVNAFLLETVDAVKARSMFDWARLLAPGTLIEEAALRRSMLLSVNQDANRFEMLAAHYLTRYSGSVYIPGFLSELAKAVVAGTYARDAAAMSRLFDIIETSKPEVKLKAYVELSAAAIAAGRLSVVQTIARKLGVLPAGSRDAVRIALHEAAALTPTTNVDKAATHLDLFDEGQLEGADAALLQAARRLATAIHAAPIPAAGPVELLQSMPTDEKNGVSATRPAVTSAQAAVVRADALLSGATQ